MTKLSALFSANGVTRAMMLTSAIIRGRGRAAVTHRGSQDQPCYDGVAKISVEMETDFCANPDVAFQFHLMQLLCSSPANCCSDGEGESKIR